MKIYEIRKKICGLSPECYALPKRLGNPINIKFAIKEVPHFGIRFSTDPPCFGELSNKTYFFDSTEGGD
jgi:hypothetical protein